LSNNGVILGNSQDICSQRLFPTIIIIEVKNKIGMSGYDPYLQGAVLYSKFWAGKQASLLLSIVCHIFRHSCLFSFHNCPFIIALARPWICISGSIFINKIITDPLTNYILLMATMSIAKYTLLQDFSRHYVKECWL